MSSKYELIIMNNSFPRPHRSRCHRRPAREERCCRYQECVIGGLGTARDEDVVA